MTIQLTKSELLHTIKFGVGKKLLETQKVSIFDRKFEILMEGVEPSDRTELINEFFGRKVNYSDPDKMISDWQSSKAGQKFIQIFKQISPESDFNSTNLFDDKAAWNALRLANDVTDGKYDVEDAKDFQEIFLKRQGNHGAPNADAKPGETKGKVDREGRRIRSRDLPAEPEAPPALKGLPPEIAKFLREIQFRHHFEQLVEEMLNKYTKQLGPEKRIDFQDIIEEHFDTIFGNFLTLNEEFTAEEIRDVIREAIRKTPGFFPEPPSDSFYYNGKLTKSKQPVITASPSTAAVSSANTIQNAEPITNKMPLIGNRPEAKSPVEIGQRPVDPSGFTNSGKYELGGRYDNISIDDEKAINQQKAPEWMRGEDLPDAEEYTDDSLPDAEEVGRDEEQELAAPENTSDTSEQQLNVPTDFADVIENYLIVPVVEMIAEADTKPGIARTKPKNMVLQAVLPGAVIVGSRFAPQLVVNHQAIVSRILKDKLVFLTREGKLFRALPQDIAKSVNAGQDTKTIRLEPIELPEGDTNQLGLYFKELLSKGNPKQKQLLRDFTLKYQNTIRRNHKLQGTKADAVTPPQQTVIGGDDTKIDHTVNGISPTADTGEAAPYVAGPQTQPDSAQKPPAAGWSGVPNAPVDTEPKTIPNLNPQDDEASQIGKTQVLTPAEQKLPIQIIGEMSKNIFEYLVRGLEHVESPKRKAEITKWIQDTFERAVQAIPKTKASVAAANVPATNVQPVANASPTAPVTSTNAPPVPNAAPQTASAPTTPITSKPAAANPTPTTSQPASTATPVNPATGAPVQSTNPQPVQAAPISTASPLAAAKPVAKARGKKSVAPISTTPAPAAASVPSNPPSVVPPVEQSADPNAAVDPNITNPAAPNVQATNTPPTPDKAQHEAQVKGYILKYALGGKDAATMQSIFKEVIDGLKENNLNPTVEELVNGRMAARSAMHKAMQATAVDKKELENYGAKAHEVTEGGIVLEGSNGLVRPKGLIKAIASNLIQIAFIRLDKLSSSIGKKSQLVKGGFLENLKMLSKDILDKSTFGYSYDESRAPAIMQAAQAALGIDQPTTEPKIQTSPAAPAAPVVPKPAKTPKVPKPSRKTVTPINAAPTENPAQASGKPNISSLAAVDPNDPNLVKDLEGQKNDLPVSRDPTETPPLSPETGGPIQSPDDDFAAVMADMDQFHAETDQERIRRNAARAAKNAAMTASNKAVKPNVAPTQAPTAQPIAASTTPPQVQSSSTIQMNGELKEKLERVKRAASSGGMSEEALVKAFNDEQGALAGTGMVAMTSDVIQTAPKFVEKGIRRLKQEKGLILIKQPNSNEYLIVPTRGMSYEVLAGLGFIESNARILNPADATIRGFIRDKELGKMTIINGDIDWDTIVPTSVTVNN